MEKNSCKLQVAGYGRTEDWNDGMMEEWKRIVTGYTLRVAGYELQFSGLLGFIGSVGFVGSQ